MNNSFLKVFACLTMLIDHIGAVFFPEYIIFRIIGRLAFPIFAFFIVEGYYKTSNMVKYVGRLFIFALISQFPFMFAFDVNFSNLNIFFTLAVGLVVLNIIDRNFNKNSTLNLIVKVALVMILLIAVENEYYTTDYGMYGVAVIVTFKAFRENFKKLTLILLIINILYVLPIMKYLLLADGSINLRVLLQSFSLFSLIFIYKYNGEKGRRLKWFFYSFYPVHLGIIAIIKYLL